MSALAQSSRCNSRGPEIPPRRSGARLARFSQLEGEQAARCPFGGRGDRSSNPLGTRSRRGGGLESGGPAPTPGKAPLQPSPPRLGPAPANPGHPSKALPPRPLARVLPPGPPAPDQAPLPVPSPPPRGPAPGACPFPHSPLRSAPAPTAPGAGSPGSAPTSGGLHPGLPRPAPQRPRRLPPAGSARPGTPRPSSPRSSGSGGDGRRKAGVGDGEGGARRRGSARSSLGQRVPPLASSLGVRRCRTTRSGRPWGGALSRPRARRGARWDSESGFLRGSGLRLPAGRGAGRGPGGGAPGLWGRGRPAPFSSFSLSAPPRLISLAPLSLLPTVLPFILPALSVRLPPLRPLGCWALLLLLRCPTRRALRWQQPQRPEGMRGWRLWC